MCCSEEVTTQHQEGAQYGLSEQLSRGYPLREGGRVVGSKGSHLDKEMGSALWTVTGAEGTGDLTAERPSRMA